jgi:hypothetical protein
MAPPYYDNSGTIPIAFPYFAIGLNVPYVIAQNNFCSLWESTCYPADTITSFGAQIEDAINDAQSNYGPAGFNSNLQYYLYSYDQPPVGGGPWITFTAVKDVQDISPNGWWGIMKPGMKIYGYTASGAVNWALGHAVIYMWSYMDDSYKWLVAHHELGHTLALADCPTCNLGTTVMYSPATTLPQNYLSCDFQQARQTVYH